MVSEGLSLDPPPLHTFSISFSRSGFGNSNGTTHSSSRAGGGGGGTASQGSHVSVTKMFSISKKNLILMNFLFFFL